MNAQAMVIDHETQALETSPKTRAAQVIKTDAAKVMDLMIRAGKDLDFDKLERMQAFYERLRAQDAESAFNVSMKAAQAEMRPVGTNKENSQTHSRYANYQALDQMARPIYTRHGFGLSFNQGADAPADMVRVECYVSHDAGFSRTYHIDMPADGKGAKGGDVMTKTHATGSAFSYGQRYLLKLIFNIAVGDDDDGNAAGGRGMGDAARRAIEEINACDGAAALAKWKADKSDGLRGLLPAGEMKEVISTYNRRVEAAKGANHGA